MGIMISMLKSQRRAFRWQNNFRARLYTIHVLYYSSQRLTSYSWKLILQDVVIICQYNMKYGNWKLANIL